MAEKSVAKKNEKVVAKKDTKKVAVKKAVVAKKPAPKAPAKSADELAFEKALAKFTKLAKANKSELFGLYKAGITRGKLAKK